MQDAKQGGGRRPCCLPPPSTVATSTARCHHLLPPLSSFGISLSLEANRRKTERGRRPRVVAAAAILLLPLLRRGLDATTTAEKFSNPRSFPYSVKQQCWEKAEKIKGRDPDRWRRDPLGNTIFRKLVGCPGCLCHDYDHIVPYSKGGKSTLETCQVLQATVNRSKGNRTEMSRADLIQKSSYCRVSGRDMDLLELSAYGNVRRGQDSGGCSMQ